MANNFLFFLLFEIYDGNFEIPGCISNCRLLNRRFYFYLYLWRNNILGRVGFFHGGGFHVGGPSSDVRRLFFLIVVIVEWRTELSHGLLVFETKVEFAKLVFPHVLL